MLFRMKRASLGLLAGLGLCALGIACSANGSRGGEPIEVATGGNGSTKGGGGAPGDGQPPSVANNTGPLDGADFGTVESNPGFTGIPNCTANCADLPDKPITEFGSNPPLFDQAAQSGGPCIIEPQDGTMIPGNWTRPRVYFTGGGDQHQIIIHADREANDLVVYTAQNPWIMPKNVWDGLRQNVFEEPITITVRSSAGGAAPRESSTHFFIAPVTAGGSIVFWASRSQAPGGDTTQLLGFSPGDEAVISTLVPDQVQDTILDDSPVPKRALAAQPAQNGQPAIEAVAAGHVRCVGCHTSTPDGASVMITDHWPWNNKVVRIEGSIGGSPDYVSSVGIC